MESDAGPSEHSFHGLILIYIIKEADSFAYSDFVFTIVYLKVHSIPAAPGDHGKAE